MTDAIMQFNSINYTVKKLDVAEMRMLRWMSGVTIMETELGMKELEGQRRWQKYPRKCRKVGNWLKWYGNVLRREDGYVDKRVMAMEVLGKRRRGRP